MGFQASNPLGSPSVYPYERFEAVFRPPSRDLRLKMALQDRRIPYPEQVCPGVLWVMGLRRIPFV